MLGQPVLTPVLAFSQCVRQILDRRGISASELARMMACKSRNTIFRILDEAGGQSARQAFYDRLIGEDPLGLSDDERAELAQAMEVSRVGRAAFMSSCALRDMLTGGDMSHETVRIDTPSGDDPGFLRMLGEMARGRKAHVIITGCCDRSIFEAIRERIDKTDKSCEVKVTHLIYTGGEEIVHNILAIQPLLYLDFYTAYCVEPGRLSREREAFYRQNGIHVLMQNYSGQWYMQTLWLVDKNVFIPLVKTKTQENDPFKRYFAQDMNMLPRLKAQLPAGQQLEDYRTFTDNCRRLEANRAIYTIRQDIPIQAIHPDILLPCVGEAFWQMAGEQKEAAKQEFYRIHLERWENFFNSKKPRCLILSRRAMERFARSGRLSDHFFAIRSHMPQERAQILSQLKAQMIANPRFHLHVFKEDFELSITEIGLYDGVGTLMTKPDTHYDLAGDHAEVFITQSEFCERYKEFYIEELLAHHVISREETLLWLDKLIEIAQEA